MGEPELQDLTDEEEGTTVHRVLDLDSEDSANNYQSIPKDANA